MNKSLDRRYFLKGAGVAIALPMLEAMTPVGRAATATTKPVKRFVCLSNNYGIYKKTFFPAADQVGANYDMPETLKPLAKHRQDFTVFSNLDHGNTIGHQGVPVLLSGVIKKRSTIDDIFLSFEQINQVSHLGELVPFDTL